MSDDNCPCEGPVSTTVSYVSLPARVMSPGLSSSVVIR